MKPLERDDRDSDGRGGNVGGYPYSNAKTSRTTKEIRKSIPAVSVAHIGRMRRGKKTFETVPGSGGLSPGPTALEGEYAFAWAKNIWSDMLS